MIVAVPDFVLSWVLVAVMVTFPATPGAMRTPAEVMEPALADQVTAELYDPVPCTVAVHCAEAPALTVDLLQLTETEVMEDGVPVVETGTMAEPLTLGFSVLVAVTVTFPAVAGAVKMPVWATEPALADQVTAELYDPVPCTVAVHCVVAPALTVEGLQLTETEVTVGPWGEVEPMEPLPPPQPEMGTAMAHAKTPKNRIGA